MTNPLLNGTATTNINVFFSKLSVVNTVMIVPNDEAGYATYI